MNINPDCDVAEHLIAMSRREMLIHPRSPVALSRESKEAIDLSGILALTPEQQLELEQQLVAA